MKTKLNQVQLELSNSSISDFLEITMEDFYSALYAKGLDRCRFRYHILSFFSGNIGLGLSEFYFACYLSDDGSYYKAVQKKDLSDRDLDVLIREFLIRQEKEQDFYHKGWFCKFNSADYLYYLFTPEELENPDHLRISEMEVSSRFDAIAFIDSYL